jgi:hypothetical protein
MWFLHLIFFGGEMLGFLFFSDDLFLGEQGFGCEQDDGDGSGYGGQFLGDSGDAWVHSEWQSDVLRESQVGGRRLMSLSI